MLCAADNEWFDSLSDAHACTECAAGHSSSSKDVDVTTEASFAESDACVPLLCEED